MEKSGGGNSAMDNASTEFGQRRYHPSESSRIKDSLQRKLTNDEVSMRPGPGGKKLTYIEHGKVVDIANHIFGFGGWSCAADSVKVDYAERDPKNNTWSVGCHALVRVMLPNGCYHTDIGWGQADRMRNRGDAQEKAMKQAVSDGRKRALRIFGSRLGNSIYDKGHLEQLQEEKTKRQRLANGPRPASCAPSFNAPQKRVAHPTPQTPVVSENANPNPSHSAMPKQMYGMKVVTHNDQQNQQSTNPQHLAFNGQHKQQQPKQASYNQGKQVSASIAPQPAQRPVQQQPINSENYYDDGINDEALAALDI